jgi:hypothetical protein
MLLRYFLNDSEMVPVAPIIYYCYHFGSSFQMHCIAIVQYIIIIIIIMITIIIIVHWQHISSHRPKIMKNFLSWDL